MNLFSPPLLTLTLLSALIPLISAATPTSFCKCTCFTNSTIIALDEPPKPSSEVLPKDLLLARDVLSSSNGVEIRVEAGEGNEGDRKQYRPGNCNDCNRQFCLGYNLPICKGATETDVFTTCFQRDSRKDEAVVFIFIFATAGLLGWALIRPWVEKLVERAKERRTYIPVATATEGS